MKTLLVNPFGLGDMIFSLYVARAIKQTEPASRVDFLCNERTLPLARLNPDLTRLYEFNRDELRALRGRSPFGFLGAYGALLGQWRSERYDRMLDFSLGREFGFLGFLAGIPRRVGFDFKGRGVFLTRRLPLSGYEGSPVAEKQLELLRAEQTAPVRMDARLGWRIPEEEQRRAETLLKDARVSAWMALAPGGGRSWGQNAVYKQWDVPRFADAANRWSQETGTGVILLGDSAEKPLLDALRSLLRVPCAVLCGESFGVAAAALKRSRFLLCNDGGLLHFAHSLGVRTVSLFGPVDETAYGPYGEGVPHEALTQSVPCRPCYRSFVFPPCAHERRCLTELSVEKVLESMRRIA